MRKKEAIRFRQAEHEQFYYEMLERAKKKDCYHQAFFYVMGIAEETRDNIGTIFDFSKGCICPEGLHERWQTGSTIRATRLAFNLWNGYIEEGAVRMLEKEIRTREIHRELKVLNRAEHLAGAVKEGSIRIKELGERPQEGDAPTAYAGEQLETGIRRGGQEVAKQTKRQVQYALRTVRKARERNRKCDESESGTSGAAQAGMPEHGQAQETPAAENTAQRSDRIRTKEGSVKGGKGTEKVTAGKGAKPGEAGKRAGTTGTIPLPEGGEAGRELCP